MVTHQLTEVWDLAARVAVLVGGRWIADEPRAGSLETFLPRYHRMTSA
jgi:ABC-type sugar transport system ATPase subunit